MASTVPIPDIICIKLSNLKITLHGGFCDRLCFSDKASEAQMIRLVAPDLVKCLTQDSKPDSLTLTMNLCCLHSQIKWQVGVWELWSHVTGPKTQVRSLLGFRQSIRSREQTGFFTLGCYASMALYRKWANRQYVWRETRELIPSSNFLFLGCCIADHDSPGLCNSGPSF